MHDRREKLQAERWKCGNVWLHVSGQGAWDCMNNIVQTWRLVGGWESVKFRNIVLYILIIDFHLFDW